MNTKLFYDVSYHAPQSGYIFSFFPSLVKWSARYAVSMRGLVRASLSRNLPKIAFAKWGHTAHCPESQLEPSVDIGATDYIALEAECHPSVERAVTASKKNPDWYRNRGLL